MASRPSLPPATPQFILRGHSSPIHALRFFRQNTRLISADADGYLVVWATDTKRAVAVWKGHEGAVLGVGTWGDRIISHGRDHRLRVWQYRPEDESQLAKSLPVDIPEKPTSSDTEPTTLKDPWLLHSLAVNALNFCAFAMCNDTRTADSNLNVADDVPENDHETAETTLTTQRKSKEGPSPSQISTPKPILLAIPNALNTGGIDIFHLPSEHRLCTIPAESTPKTGMVMALALRFINSNLFVVAGYESGHTFTYSCPHPPPPSTPESTPTSNTWKWRLPYTQQSHTQPILSLALSPDTTAHHNPNRQDSYYITTSADALVVKHPFPPISASTSNTNKSTSQLPLQVLNTKHASQQSISIRSDGIIFATSGWDGRVRVYGTGVGVDSVEPRDNKGNGKGEMKEKAVLKWHGDGVFSCAFADVDSAPDSESGFSSKQVAGNLTVGIDRKDEGTVIKRVNAGSLEQIKSRRKEKASRTHWLAAGGKDGKISLWDIY